MAVLFADIDIETLSEEAKGRHQLMLESVARLAQIAHRAIHEKGQTTNSFMVVCIVVDSRWRDLVDYLMPDHDWQQYRDSGLEPMARGSVLVSLADVLIEELPDLADALREQYPEGTAKAVVLDDTGGTVYQIEPKPESPIQ